MNNEFFGNLEQAFWNDLKSSEQTARKIKFVSSIDHYYSLHRLVPPHFNVPPATAGLLPRNEVKSAIEFQALSINHYLPIDKPQSYANVPSPYAAGSQSCGTDEVGFSSLFSLEYSFPDFGSKSFQHLNSENSIEERQNVSSLSPQFYLKQSKEQLNPLFTQKYVQQNLGVHEQPHNLPSDKPLPYHLNSKETDKFDYNYPSLVEPTYFTSNSSFNNCHLTPFQSFESTTISSNPLEKSKSCFDQSRSVSSTEKNETVTLKKIPGDKSFVSNLIPEKPGSSMTLENCNRDYTSFNPLSESPVDFKNEIVNKSDNLISPNNKIKPKKENVSKEKTSDFEVWNERSNTGESDNCRHDLACDVKTTFPEKVSDALETSLKPTTLKETSVQNLNPIKPKECKNLGNCSVKEQNQNLSESPIVLSCEPDVFVGSTHFSPNKKLEFETCPDALPVECDSTTESGLQQTDHTNSLLSHFNETSVDVQNPSGEILESDTSDGSFLEAGQLLKPNKCRICKEFLLTERPLLQQLTVPVDANFDVCNACNICFLQKSILNTNGGDEKNPHKCTYCDRRFKKECYLVLHIRSHTTEKPFRCSECNKGFANSSKLKLHSTTHSRDKPFVCKECDRHFVQVSHLKMHSRIHFGDKPYKCNTCLKDFASKSKLSEHEKYHSPKLPFKCTTCEKSFVKKTYFESHLRIHCDAKPFQCTTCNTCFAQKSVLRQHTKNCRTVIDSKDDVRLIATQDFVMSNIES